MQEIHRRLQRHVKHRLESVQKGEGLDWATAEVTTISYFLLSGSYKVDISWDIGNGLWLADARGLRRPDLGPGCRPRYLQSSVCPVCTSPLFVSSQPGRSHAMLVDQNTEGVVVPLNNELKPGGRLELANSKFF
jgi:probable 2-oxoglutarate dehydrogenase E1 component DHKTD1